MLEKKEVTEGEVGVFRIGVLLERVFRVVVGAMTQAQMVNSKFPQIDVFSTLCL